MPYTMTPTAIPEVLILESKVFGDARGFFFESVNQRDFAEKRVLTCPLCRTTTANSWNAFCEACTA